MLSVEAAGVVITALLLNHRSWLYDRHDEAALATPKKIYATVKELFAVLLEEYPSGDTMI